MDSRRGEERKGRPHNISAGSRGKSQAALGFEGMNYEQKRKPYKEGNSDTHNGFENLSSDENFEKRRDH